MKKYCKGFTLILSLVLVACLSLGVTAETITETEVSSVSPEALTYTSPFVKDDAGNNLVYTVPSPVLSLGVDVSAWQGEIDWQKMANAGVKFALIRVVHHNGHTNAMEDDKYYVQNIEGAQAAGIKVGVYVFSQAITEQEARDEAAYLIGKISKYNLEMPLVFDFEWEHANSEGQRGRLYDANLSKAAATNVCLAFCDYVSSYGYSPMVYANAWMLGNRLDAAALEKKADIWMANYATSTVYKNHFDYWQYSSSGQIDGVPKENRVDCNFAFVDKVYNIPFKDLNINKWYYKSVVYVYKNKLFAGVAWDWFSPDTAMTRAMIVSVLYRMEGSPAVSGGSGFGDLTKNWYKNSVVWAQQNNIISGEAPTVFGPDNDVTREQLAAILYRYAKYKGYDTSVTGSLDGFRDGNRTSAYAKTYLQWAVGAGVISGFEDKTVRPKNSATRAEVASVLKRFCEKNSIY